MHRGDPWVLSAPGVQPDLPLAWECGSCDSSCGFFALCFSEPRSCGERSPRSGGGRTRGVAVDERGKQLAVTHLVSRSPIYEVNGGGTSALGRCDLESVPQSDTEDLLAPKTNIEIYEDVLSYSVWYSEDS